MTKILNINALVKEKRELELDGKVYVMKELSVKDFVDLTKRAEKVDKSKGESALTRVNFLVETIGVNFPDCPREVLEERTIEELNIIFEFAKSGIVPKSVDTKSVDTKSVEGKEEKKDQAQN